MTDNTAGTLERPRVLLGIHSPDVIESVGGHLSRLGCACLSARDSETFARLIQEENLSAAVVELSLDGRSTVELCRQHRRLLREAPVLCWACDDSRQFDEVVAAVRAGVSDVMVSPRQVDKLDRLAAQAKENYARSVSHGPVRRIVRAPGKRQAPDALAYNGDGAITNGRTSPASSRATAHRAPAATPAPCNSLACEPHDAAPRLEEFLIGSSAVMNAVRRTITQVAATKATVMICGESGTGKELVATAIHVLGARRDGPFVPVNMAAIPDGLAESLLFGHEKGAFTSAIKRQVGHCEAAHNGTLFLDEISEMELQIQPKLLRFLQSGTFQRIGSEAQQGVDARIITATNYDPKSMVREGKMREDLFFRLHVVPIHVPALRERSGDIEELASVFLRRSAAAHERDVREFSDEALDVLQQFEWPGNVRQLENIVERMVIFARGPLVTAEEVPAEVQTVSFGVHNGVSLASGHPNGRPSKCGDLLDGEDGRGGMHLSPIQHRERAAIIEALQRVDGHVVEASKLLGLGQATVYRKIKRYSIPHSRTHRRLTE